MKKNISVTIGIPAWNEEDNIGNILSDLLQQESVDCDIKIMVCSDASDDKTDKIVREFKDAGVGLVRHQKRKGKAGAINTLMSISKSDILIIIDADVRIEDKYFVKKIVRPVINNSADLVSANQKYARPLNYFEGLLALNMDLKSTIFSHYQNGDNFFTCHGQARAFSKKLYKKIVFPFSVGEDLFSYVYCHINGYKYDYVDNAYAIFRLPNNIRDHENQSSRFLETTKLVEEYFGKEKVKYLTEIPWKLVVFWTAVFLIRHPVKTLGLNFLFAYIRIKSIFKDKKTDHWDKVKSSKLT